MLQYLRRGERGLPEKGLGVYEPRRHRTVQKGRIHRENGNATE